MHRASEWRGPLEHHFVRRTALEGGRTRAIPLSPWGMRATWSCNRTSRANTCGGSLCRRPGALRTAAQTERGAALDTGRGHGREGVTSPSVHGSAGVSLPG